MTDITMTWFCNGQSSRIIKKM